ncbi:hypothetical protein EV401DRAFT_1963456 [Pisolithus croceorrhizus]|nr:hypothetical protein EV401DRAFT_1963456 [Pisolithus croceorrhizus]
MIFSAYAPQLGARLHVSHTQLNIIGLAGIDSRGPQIPLAGASVCSIPGYAGIKRMYDDGTGLGTSVSTAHFALLITCGFLTALGARAGIISAINATAKSFPESAVCPIFLTLTIHDRRLLV